MSHKVCFVTIGATAKFDQLVSAVLSKSFLDALGKENYTLIRIQYGKSGPELFNALVSRAEQENGGKLPHRLMVDGFNISDTSFEQLMRIAKPEEGRREGMVVSHAGAGSVLDAMRISAPVVVVPNPTLAGNHQEEFAEKFEAMGYVVYGKLDDLAVAVPKIEARRSRDNQYPPVNSGPHRVRRGAQGKRDARRERNRASLQRFYARAV